MKPTMKNLFGLTEADVDALIADFRSRRDAAMAAEEDIMALVWHQAVNAIHEARMDAAQRRLKRIKPKPGIRIGR